MDDKKIFAKLEALLFAYAEPIKIDKLCDILEIPTQEMKLYLDKLKEKMSLSDRGIELICINDKYQLCTKKEYAEYIQKAVNDKKNASLSMAALEILAIVAYNQPVTKSFIEQIRGVDCAYTLNSLITKDLVEEAGRLNLPGRPITYKTTDNFLRCFGISNLDGLPSINRENDNSVVFLNTDGQLMLKS